MIDEKLIQAGCLLTEQNEDFSVYGYESFGIAPIRYFVCKIAGPDEADVAMSKIRDWSLAKYREANFLKRMFGCTGLNPIFICDAQTANTLGYKHVHQFSRWHLPYIVMSVAHYNPSEETFRFKGNWAFAGKAKRILVQLQRAISGI